MKHTEQADFEISVSQRGRRKRSALQNPSASVGKKTTTVFAKKSRDSRRIKDNDLIPTTSHLLRILSTAINQFNTHSRHFCSAASPEHEVLIPDSYQMRGIPCGFVNRGSFQRFTRGLTAQSMGHCFE